MARTEHADDNRCTRCGACCASFRVDFAADELLSEGGSVPDGLADPLTGRLWRLRGTDHARPRCAALQGTVGQQVRCGIHEWRPSPCREFGARAPFGQGDDACTRARARHGLPPLTDEPAADVSVGRVAAPFGSRRGRPGCAS